MLARSMILIQWELPISHFLSNNLNYCPIKDQEDQFFYNGKRCSQITTRASLFVLSFYQRLITGEKFFDGFKLPEHKTDIVIYDLIRNNFFAVFHFLHLPRALVMFIVTMRHIYTPYINTFLIYTAHSTKSCPQRREKQNR